MRLKKRFADGLRKCGRKYASVVTSKAAICGHFKTGHMDWPET
jgi:hypothetical protein